MNETLSWARLWLLIRSDAITDYRFVAIVSGVIAGLMLLSTLTTGNTSTSFYQGWFAAALFVWGAVNASFSFRELHDKTRNESYLLLPASALEKTLARLLRSTVGFVAYLVIFMSVFSPIIETVKWIVLGRTNPVFMPLDPAVWKLVAHFIVLQSLFFLGAAWFRRWHFIKTLLVLNLAPIGLSVLAATVFRIVLGENPELVFSGLSEGAFYAFYVMHKAAFDAALAVCEAVYFVVVPLFCWSVAWLRVKETQVSDGV